MPNRLQGKKIAFLEAFKAKSVDEFAEGIHVGQRQRASVS
jgi:hypothetical protein